jgi:uncharacterized protein YlxW (UPF0749 family)
MRDVIFWVWMMSAAVWGAVAALTAVSAVTSEAPAAGYREPTTREIVLAIKDLERKVEWLDQRVENLENGE